MTETQLVQYAAIAIAVLVALAPVAHTIMAFARALKGLANMTKTSADDNALSAVIGACAWVILMCGKGVAFLSRFTAPPSGDRR